MAPSVIMIKIFSGLLLIMRINSAPPSDTFKINMIKWFPNNRIILWSDSQLDIKAEPDELAQCYLSRDLSKRRSNQHFGIRHTSTVLNTQTYTNQTWWWSLPTNHEQIEPNHLGLYYFNDMLYKEKTPYEILNI